MNRIVAKRYRSFGLYLVAGLGLVLSGCASGGGRPTATISTVEQAYLISPSSGWPSSLSPEQAAELERSFRDLVDGGEWQEVQSRAAEMLRQDPGFYPAAVLDAQARFAAGEYERVAERLAPVQQAVPGYVAAEVLYGRALEHLERPLEAFEAYWSVRQKSTVAATQVDSLLGAALDELASELDGLVADGLTERAAQTLARMQLYAPADARTVEAERALSETAADPVARLTLLRQLTAEPGADPDLVRRRAELEVQVGDAATAVRLAEGLVEQTPGDAGLEELLHRAQFQWRLDVLPADVGRLGRAAQLSRGDYAVLLYWLVPGVRYGRPSEARIATDIIDHPHREQIVRVINMGLLDVDSTVHRFGPEQAISPTQALRSLLALLGLSPTAGGCFSSDGATSVGAGSETRLPSGRAEVCEAAVACNLMMDVEECVRGATLSGAQALEMIRRMLATTGAG